VPHGLQSNGIFLATALFGSPSAPTPGYGSPQLSSDTVNGQNYTSVNHVVTTTIAGCINNTPTVSVVITGARHALHERQCDRSRDGPHREHGERGDATHLTAQAAIGVNATPGVRNLTVTTGSQIVTLANAFTVNAPPVPIR